jgi:hypothetical protein
MKRITFRADEALIASARRVAKARNTTLSALFREWLLECSAKLENVERPTGTIDSFIGLLAGKTEKIATIEEIEQASARGWSGKA